jgi:predicted ABC-type ATPase
LVERPQLLIVGGPNGSGKTTVAKQFANANAVPYIGADEIAANLAPSAPESARIDAGRQFFRIIENVITTRQSCVIESTLSGRSFRNTIQLAAQFGFEILIVFLFVDSVDVCFARVAERVRKGGHDVPEVDIRRRYHRSIRNFWTIYRNLSDRRVVLYNGGERLQSVVVGSHAQMTIRDDGLYSAFLELTEPENDS